MTLRDSITPLAAALAITFGSALAQDLSSLNEPYGFQFVANRLDSLGSNGGAVIGVLTFDGGGNIIGTSILKSRTGRPQDASTGQAGVSGTYTLNPDSTGVMKLQFEFGF